jgi:membrane-associated phospholipid phosphatase
LNRKLALFLSAVFNPLLMPTLLFGTLIWQTPAMLGLDTFSVSLRMSVLALICVGTFFLPALLIYYLYRIGYVGGLYLHNRHDRRVPYLITVLTYAGLTYWFGFQMSLLSVAAPEIAVVLGSMTVSILLVGVISLAWKISAHGTGMGGASGALLGAVIKFADTDLLPVALGSVLLAGLVGSARLQLNAHTPAQVGAGLALGFMVSMSAVMWLL